MYASSSRSSVLPEVLLKSTVLMAMYSMRRRSRRTVAGEKGYDTAGFVGGGRKLCYWGRERNQARFELNIAVYNLIRITNLDLAAA